MSSRATELGQVRHWRWISPEFRNQLPDDLESRVMELESDDRLHEKQGRSTCRVTFNAPHEPLRVYLKRHYRLPWRDRIVAWLDPDGRRTPAGTEWRHLEFARRLGLRVPDSIAAGEEIGPWAQVRSYLMLRELPNAVALNEILPVLAGILARDEFEAWKRRVTRELAQIAATLHRRNAYHKDLYLCHFFVDVQEPERPGHELAIIDLHRLSVHRWTSAWWRWKDLGQLLFSTVGVEGLSTRDRLRFWTSYTRYMGLKQPRWEARLVRLRARRYLRHNRTGDHSI